MLAKQTDYIVGIYLRLSKDDERAGESLSIENQRRILTNYVREQGWTIYDEYVDDGISGTSFDEHSNGNKTVSRAISDKQMIYQRALHHSNALFLFR
jgi:DNA invertase Pin-like site-specific DNA recombinase